MAKQTTKAPRRATPSATSKSPADAAFDAGDYKTALSLYLQAVHSDPGTEVGHKALARAQALRLDPVALYAGFGTMLLVALAAAWALAPYS